ncbi:MAG: response regulator [Candidatus Geothermincolales bacterium]
MDPVHPKCIMLVDDDELILKLLNLNFSPCGYHVISCIGGESAFRTALEARPDLIILDIMMPRTDGWKVLEQLKGDERTCDIPVVVLTVKVSPEDRQRAIDMGASRYVAKPFNPSELVQLVEELVGT